MKARLLGANLKRQTTLIGTSLVLALALVGTLPAEAQESLFGTWKMNASKSRLDLRKLLLNLADRSG